MVVIWVASLRRRFGSSVFVNRAYPTWGLLPMLPYYRNFYMFFFDFRKINGRTKNFEKYTSAVKSHGGMSSCRHGARC
jgi:hypothetical protein